MFFFFYIPQITVVIFQSTNYGEGLELTIIKHTSQETSKQTKLQLFQNMSVISTLINSLTIIIQSHLYFQNSNYVRYLYATVIKSALINHVRYLHVEI